MSDYPPPHLALARAKVPKDAIKLLCVIPGVGSAMAADLYLLGVHDLDQLSKRDPQKLYSELCTFARQNVDRCVLYVFRCAVYYASTENHEPELLKWWNWKNRELEV
jgi:hypothetical protein